MKITTLEVAGIIPAIQGMRNPMNSWYMGDSYTDKWAGSSKIVIGPKDLDLAKRLIKAGGEHRKFLRQIQVWADMDMPRYWWSEFDTYHFNTKNSCSTMHKLLNKDDEITIDQFIYCDEDRDIVQLIIARLNAIREIWLDTDASAVKLRCLVRAKRLLMEGFLQMRTVNTNYEEIMNIYHQRKTHRLKDEWSDVFCKWCESLPYFRELCIERS